MKLSFLYPLLLLPLGLAAQPKIQLVQFGTATFDQPLDITHAGDSRLFVVERPGRIWILDSAGNKSAAPFLDIQDKVLDNSSERGLLGLAFHPDYAQNGYFYVNYTVDPGGHTRISRFTRSATDPGTADPASELVLVAVTQPFNNHNGGCVKFGPDGYLYFALGDGGSGGDPQNNGQRKNTLLGKISRIDVDTAFAGLNYGIPPDNPFVNDADYRPEIWSLGWRNPWRFSFDRVTGDMWIADVGQNAIEEVNFEAAGQGGHNYGWRCYEGNNAFNTNGCQPAAAYTFPVFTYSHSDGCSITGGFVYRGTAFPDMYGYYMVTDYCSGRWWSVLPSDGGFTSAALVNLTDFQYSSLGEDVNGELYVTALGNGRIFRLTERCAGFSLSATVTPSSCGPVPDGAVTLQTQGGQMPVTYLWSGGQTTASIANLAPGVYSVVAEDGIGCLRRDTFEVTSPIAQVPPPDFDNITPPLLCGTADTVVLEGPAAPDSLGYQWFFNGLAIPGATSRQLTLTEPGTYSLAYSLNACLTATDSIGVPQVLPPVISVGADNQLSVVSGLGAYVWQVQNDQGEWDNLPGATTPEYQADMSGLFRVVVTTLEGCVLISDPVGITPAQWPASVQTLRLWPNPATAETRLLLKLKSTQEFSIALIDANGRQLFFQTHQKQQLALPIHLQAAAPGWYTVVIQLPDGVIAKRLLKQ